MPCLQELAFYAHIVLALQPGQELCHACRGGGWGLNQRFEVVVTTVVVGVLF